MCEAIYNFISSEMGVGFAGAIIGGLLSCLGAYLAQRSSNKVTREQTRLTIYKDREATLLEECLGVFSRLEADPSYALDKQLYFSLLALCMKSKTLAQEQMQKELRAITAWIESIQESLSQKEEEMAEKYFSEVCIESPHEDEPSEWDRRFIGSDFEQFESDLKACKNKFIPEKKVVENKLQKFVELAREEIFVDEQAAD